MQRSETESLLWGYRASSYKHWALFHARSHLIGQRRCIFWSVTDFKVLFFYCVDFLIRSVSGWEQWSSGGFAKTLAHSVEWIFRGRTGALLDPDWWTAPDDPILMSWVETLWAAVCNEFVCSSQREDKIKKIQLPYPWASNQIISIYILQKSQSPQSPQRAAVGTVKDILHP